MTIFGSNRTRRKFFGIVGFVQIISFIVSFAAVTYVVLYFRHCIDTQCNFNSFLSYADPLLGIIIGIVAAMIFSLMQYFPNHITKQNDSVERCNELKSQITSLKGDYIQLKNIELPNRHIIINQKNSRLVLMSNLVDLLRNHYSEKLIQDMSFICDKGLRFPCSLQEQSAHNFEEECDKVLKIIEDVTIELDKEHHNKHK